MTRRPGISLTEILVALFIMALGVIAILTMFPMGLITMGQALKDDRATQCAYQAEAYMRWLAKDRGKTELFFSAMNTPGGGLPSLQPNDSDESYPVFVDPMGMVMGRTSPQADWMGDGGQGNGADQTNVPRRSLSIINSASLAQRACSLLDTLGYDEGGRPSGGADMRTLQYNWAWMLQRQSNSDQFNVEMKVIVYDKRVHQFLPSATEKVYTLDPSQPAIVFPASTTNLKFPSSAAPPVQKGGWLLDATVTNINATTGGVRNANFYRVVSVTANGATVDIELQTPLRDPSGNAAGFNPVTQSRFVVLNGLYEIFEMPPLTEFGP